MWCAIKSNTSRHHFAQRSHQLKLINSTQSNPQKFQFYDPTQSNPTQSNPRMDQTHRTTLSQPVYRGASHTSGDLSLFVVKLVNFSKLSFFIFRLFCYRVYSFWWNKDFHKCIDYFHARVTLWQSLGHGINLCKEGQENINADYLWQNTN